MFFNAADYCDLYPRTREITLGLLQLIIHLGKNTLNKSLSVLKRNTSIHNSLRSRLFISMWIMFNLSIFHRKKTLKNQWDPYLVSQSQTISVEFHWSCGHPGESRCCWTWWAHRSLPLCCSESQTSRTGRWLQGCALYPEDGEWDTSLS